MRVSELRDLTMDIIDLKKQEAVIETKKNKQRRVIMWDSETKNLLEKYLELLYCI
jgi:integrase